jgi:hypothetical protein
VDASTLRVGFKSVKAMTVIMVDPVREGKYRSTIPSIGAKAGDAVDPAEFKLALPQDLLPGEYALSISVQDAAGNTLSDTKVYTVK